MRKFLVTSAIVATSFIGVSSASACSDLSFLTAMGQVNKQAMKAATLGEQGDYRTGRDYVTVARNLLRVTPTPCAAKYKLTKYQYRLALDYEHKAFSAAIGGNYSAAIRHIKTSTTWMRRATSSMS